MWMKHLKRKIEKNKNEVLGIFLRKYPPFVLKDSVDHAEDIPVFAFHDVTPERLEPILEFLAKNKYRTLTADEYFERKLRGHRGQNREVMLTFDDGYKSLYTTVYPALRRFEMNGVAYIVPGRTPEGDDLEDRHPWKEALCNWAEIQEMHQSGFVDFQSHSMYHHSISVSSQVLDFIRPGVNLSFLKSDLAPLIDRGVENDELHCGSPIYDWGPRFGERQAFQEPPSVGVACVGHVKKNGGLEFFKKTGWRESLEGFLVDVHRKDSGSSFEGQREQREAILGDLQDSKSEIERRLPGKKVRHFCFPWFLGSSLAAKLSGEAGYVTNAWGSLLPHFISGERSPLPVARLSPSYLWRLPGKGRKSLLTVLLGKRASSVGSSISVSRLNSCLASVSNDLFFSRGSL